MAVRPPVEAKQATAKGDGLKEVVLGAPAFFEIDTNGMDGLVDVKIIGMCPPPPSFVKKASLQLNTNCSK